MTDVPLKTAGQIRIENPVTPASTDLILAWQDNRLGTCLRSEIDAYLVANLGVPASVQAAIDALVASAPGALDTLNELAAALGDDENFAASVTASLALKANKAGTDIHDLIEKTAPIDADEFRVADSADGWSFKRLSWTNLKAAIWAFINANYVTPWVAYTPTFTGIGTPSVAKVRSRRVGSNLEVEAIWINGTVSATEFSMTMGFNGINGGVVCDSFWFEYRPVVGVVAWNISGASSRFVIAAGSLNAVNIGAATVDRDPLTPVQGSYLGTSRAMEVRASIPIEGWS